MRKFFIATLVSTSFGCFTSYASAQNPLERRAERNLRQADRQEQRLGNRTNYYTDNTWKQVSPWVSKYELRPVQRAANAAANTAANVAANARFGFSQKDAAANPQAAWFYDYYAMPYTSYAAKTGNTNAYSSAYTFNDSNNDGVYDEFFTYRDTDNKGRYDEYDQYDFSEAKKDSQKSERHDGLYDANRHTVSGKIEASKTAKVNGTQHTVVRVKGEKEELTIVDLGPSTALSAYKTDVGQDIVVSGPLMQIGEKEVLIAESVKISQKEVVIARTAPRLTGIVLDSTNAEVQKGTHSIVVIKSDDGNQLIDLGNSDQLKIKIAPQSKIVVWGVPVQMRDQRVILADKIEVNGQSYDIKRW